MLPRKLNKNVFVGFTWNWNIPEFKVCSKIRQKTANRDIVEITVFYWSHINLSRDEPITTNFEGFSFHLDNGQDITANIYLHLWLCASQFPTIPRPDNWMEI